MCIVYLLSGLGPWRTASRSAHGAAAERVTAERVTAERVTAERVTAEQGGEVVGFSSILFRRVVKSRNHLAERTDTRS
jgi:nitrous oxide reductase accessory protein NosL